MTLALYGKSRRRQWALVALALFALLGAFSAAMALRESARAATGTVNLNPAHVGVVNDTFSQGSCPTPPSGQEGWYGWHFIMPANANFTSLSVTFQTAGTISANPFPGTAFIAHPDNSHAYVWTPTNDKLLSGTATYSTDKKNPPDKFNLSHVCSGSEAPDPSVSVEKSHTPSGPFTPGDTFDWVITVSVTGNTTDAATTVSDQLPAQFDYGTVEAPGFTNCAIDGNKLLTCTLPSGKAVYDYTITIPVTVPEDIEHCGVVENSVSITGENVDSPSSDTDSVTVNCGQTIVTTIRVCKVFEDNGDGVTRGDTTFNFEIEYLDENEDEQTASTSITLAEGEGPECKDVELPGDISEATVSELATSITDEDGYPKYDVMGDSPTEGDRVDLVIWSGEGCSDLQDFVSLRQAESTELPIDLTCTVTFYNRETPGQVESRGLILVEKYIEIDGNLATTLPGEGLVAGWTVTVDGVSKLTTLPSAVSFEAIVGDTVPVSEATPPGYNVLGHTVNGGALQAGSSTNILVTEATTLVRFYNQPLGSLTVNKVALTSHNNSPDVPSPQDRDGWTITVSSAACGINQSKQTDASGNATFTGLPKCTDYVVSENTSNPQSPNFVPVGASSVSNVTPNGQTITFTNRRATFDILIITPTPVIPTPTPTFTPTNTPTSTPTNTPTATPTPEETQAGVRTPGPTPIAPSTGTGSGGGAASVNLLLLIAGFAVLSGGATLAAVGKRRR